MRYFQRSRCEIKTHHLIQRPYGLGVTNLWPQEAGMVGCDSHDAELRAEEKRTNLGEIWENPRKSLEMMANSEIYTTLPAIGWNS